MDDLISRQAAIDALNVDAELLKRVLDDADVVGAERAKYEWGLELIESYIYDMEDLPSIDAVQVIRCKDCMWWDTSWKPTWAIGEEHWCSSNDTFMWPKDYCSKAERIES